MSNVFRPVANQSKKYFVEYLYHYALVQLQLVGGYSVSCQIKNKIHITKTSDPKTIFLFLDSITSAKAFSSFTAWNKLL